MERFRALRPLSRERALIYGGMVVGHALTRLERPAELAGTRCAGYDLADLAEYAAWLQKRLAPMGDPDAGKPPLAPLTEEERETLAKELKAAQSGQGEKTPDAEEARRAHEKYLRRKERDPGYVKRMSEKRRARRERAQAKEAETQTQWS